MEASSPHAPKPQKASIRGGKFLILLLFGFLVGAASTGHLLAGIQFPEFKSQLFTLPALLSTFACIALTTVNILIRWSRWHFLIRRFTPHLVTRDSLAVYLVTLPAIISPFFLAELGRVFLIRRRFRTPASYLVRIWFAERFLDFCVVTSALLCAIAIRGTNLHVTPRLIVPVSFEMATIGTLILFIATVLLFRLILRSQDWKGVTLVLGGALLTTAVAWTLPVLALVITLELLGPGVSAAGAVQTFGQGTILGGLTGLPLGVYVTGSTMIGELVRVGVPYSVSVLSILVYRSGTAWFAVLLGLASLFIFKGRMRALLRGDSEAHFDEIASEYEGEIPAHVRERLLHRKTVLIRETLATHQVHPGAKGLDLGCGQGWYLMDMRSRGFDIDGTDYSQGQLDGALANVRQEKMKPGTLVQADAQELPFEDNTYDFVYSINAIHHILAEGAQQKALGEIVRVLKPGGVFLLHEINTYNPVFRWYMGYLFPLLKKIDEGNEEWILPTALPPTRGATWDESGIEYFTFLPDFVPQRILLACAGIERFLERSRFRRMSAHYQACLVKAKSDDLSGSKT